MKYLIGLICLFFGSLLIAQPPESKQEEILIAAEQMPMFPGCTDITDDKKAQKECSDKKMLEFIHSNIKYPERDQLNGNQGTAVITFTVEKDGSISNPTILKDPGDQLGEEAVRVVNLMNQLPEKWSPGIQDGVPVRVQFNLPVKFKLEEVVEPDFILSGKDSIWVKFDTPATFKGGDEALVTYIDQSLRYPNEGQDSCKIGMVEVSMFVKDDASVDISNVVDFSGLGIDYEFEAIRVINSTAGKWIPATFGKRTVNTSKTLRMIFTPNLITCGDVVSNFHEADRTVEAATILFEQGQMDEGIAKLTEAIEMFPNNGEFLSLRGQAYIKMQKNEEACADLRKVKDILVVSWYDSLIPIICK